MIVLNLSIISGLGTYFRYGIIFYACEVSSKHLHTFRVTYPSLWISNNESHVDKAVDGMLYDPSAGDTHFHQLKDESGCKKAKKMNCRITSIRSHPRLPFAFLYLSSHSGSSLTWLYGWKEQSVPGILVSLPLGCHGLAAMFGRRSKLLGIQGDVSVFAIQKLCSHI